MGEMRDSKKDIQEGNLEMVRKGVDGAQQLLEAGREGEGKEENDEAQEEEEGQEAKTEIMG